MPAPATPDATPARPGRCSLHPSTAAVGTCSVCGRAMCVACAVPVRGVLVGAECLPTVLEDAPEVPLPPPAPARGGGLAVAGFGVAVVASLLPWARFGPVSGFLEAWTLHWSLLAATAATAGFLLAVLGRLIVKDTRWTAAALLVLGIAVVLGAVLHAVRPPPLSRADALSVTLAVVGAAVALVGAGRLAITALLRSDRSSRRGPASPSSPAG